MNVSDELAKKDELPLFAQQLVSCVLDLERLTRIWKALEQMEPRAVRDMVQQSYVDKCVTTIDCDDLFGVTGYMFYNVLSKYHYMTVLMNVYNVSQKDFDAAFEIIKGLDQDLAEVLVSYDPVFNKKWALRLFYHHTRVTGHGKELSIDKMEGKCG